MESLPPPKLVTEFQARGKYAGVMSTVLQNWLVILLSVLLLIDYIILWARLPMVYGGMIAGTLPFSMAFVYAIHRIIRDPRIEKTLGLKLFMFVVVIYLIVMMYFATQIPKQNCTRMN